MDRHYKITDIKNEEFYMLPKSLFENDVLKDLAPSSKIIYAILKDRMWLSWENEWCDDNGDIYFLFNQEGLAEISCISLKTVQRSMAELKNCGLIDIKRQGQGKPSKLYINKLPLCPIKKGQNDLSRQVKMTFLDKSKCPTNNTNISNTENNNIYGSQKKTRKKKEFVPPTLEEITEHIKKKVAEGDKRYLNISPQYFIDYYNAADWHIKGGKKVSNWKQCMVTWVNNGYSNQKQEPQKTTVIKNTLPEMTDEEAERLRREMYGES